MPLKLDSRDRRLLLVGASIFLLLVIGAVILTSGRGSRAEVPTTYSTGSGGAKAAYLLLQESGYKTLRWERPLSDLPEPAGKILIVADPQEAPTPEDRERLQQFIVEGGHVIATGMFAGFFLPRSAASPDVLGSLTWKHLSALAPSRITRAAPQIVLAPEASWNSLSSALPLYGDSDQTGVVKYAMGKGEVIWWASAVPLTNAGLKEAANLDFFLACLGEERKEVLWDEYIHGYRPTLAGSVLNSSVPWIFLQVALLGLAVLATFSRRSGPVFVPVTESRLSPLEFVNTLGGLYQRAGAASVAVDVSYQRFRYWLTRRLGMASNVSVDDLQSAVRDRLNLSDADFAATLKECEAARHNPDLDPAYALRLVQELDAYAGKMKLFRVSSFRVSSKEKAE